MSQRSRHQVLFVSAPAGSGKSFSRAKWIVDYFLPEEKGDIVTNLPLNVDEVVKYVCRNKSLNEEEIRDRIVIIPHPVWLTWQTDIKVGGSGPWDWLRELYGGYNFEGAHIIIDEAHYIGGAKHSPQHLAEWGKFCGEVRHNHATLEFMSQHENKVARSIRDECGGSVYLSNGEKRKFLHVPFSDFYELRAKFLTRKYTSIIWEEEQRKVGTKTVLEVGRKWSLDPFYFKFYDSYNNLESGTKTKNSAPKHEFEKRSHFGLLFWFVRRNLYCTTILTGFVASLIFILFFNGASKVGRFANEKFTSGVKSIIKNKQKKRASKTEPESKKKVPAIAPESKNQPKAITGKTSFVSNENGELLSESRPQLIGRINTLEAANKALMRSADYIKQLLQPSTSIGIITQDSIVFRDGAEFRIGERIDAGPFENQVVKSIDYNRRRAMLESGLILRLLSSRDLGELPETTLPTKTERPVPRPVRPVTATHKNKQSQPPR